MKHQIIINACESIAKDAKNPAESSDYRRGVRDVIGVLAGATIRDTSKLSAELNRIYCGLM